MDRLERFLDRAEGLIERLEETLGRRSAPIFAEAIAYRWRGPRGLCPVAHPHRLELDDLRCMERQKGEIVRNTRQFVAGRGANNVLLWGARGTGKSSLIKAVLHAFADRGLRLIEVERQFLGDLPEIVELLYGRPERFVLYCDDLSFEGDDAGYKSFKALLDGSIAAAPENCLIYATSNRRHLLPESSADNEHARLVEGELHPGEAVEEKISLSERFGLWLSFHPFSQDQYLEIVDHWLSRFDSKTTGDSAETRRAALQWALLRGSRSGRVAWQFARDWAGRASTTQV